MKVLKDRLELEKQAWEASYVKKEVMAGAAPCLGGAALRLRADVSPSVAVSRKPGCSPGSGSLERR